jgi:hypothetical protein
MTNSSGKAAQPVFVDSTGSRRRWLAVFAVAGGAVLALASAMLIAGFLGGGPGHLPGLPDAPRPEPIVGQPHPADRSPVTPSPSRVSHPASSGGTSGSPVNPAGSVLPPSATPTLPGHRNTAHPTPSHKK